jgi:hypothetical protein
VLASVHQDCSVSMSLINDNTDGANILAECNGVLYLLTEGNAIASGCMLVTLQLEQFPSCLPGLSSCPGTPAVGIPIDVLALEICVDLALDPVNCGTCGVTVSASPS